MINRTKLAVFVVVALTRLVATPAFAQSFDADEGTGNVLPYSSQANAAQTTPRHATVHTAHRNGMDAYAMEPRVQTDSNPDSPASTGGGSAGYNENLYNY
jgi:hypothetical protein